MELSEVLKYYVGCKVQYVGMANPKVLTMRWLGSLLETEAWKNIKPILRKLSDMSEEEAIEYFDLPKGAEILKRRVIRGKYLEFEWRFVNDNPKLNIEDGYCYSASAIKFDGTRIDNYPAKFHYLLSKHFDLWNLIESGQAIDKKTL